MSQGEGRQCNELKRRFDEFCGGDRGWKGLSTAHDSAPARGFPSPAMAEYGSLFSHGQHLRPFVTDKGYLGLGSENLQEGDTVWVVLRTRVPLIFRRVKDVGSVANYHCELVVGAYVHGFMDGRALLASALRDGVSLNDATKTVIIY